MSTVEIGGYFELERFGGAPYHKDLIALNAARFALLYLIKARRIAKLYIPFLLCDCVAFICKKYGCAYECYNVDESLLPRLEKTPGENEYVYIVNYYGQLSNDAVAALKSKYERIILDNVQDFFRRPLPAVDTLYSCRKFFGVPDGAYLSTDAVLPGDLPVSRSASRFSHLLGRFEGAASAYYGAFCEAEEAFYECGLSQMSALSKNILSGVDYERVKNKRNENYQLLSSALGGANRMAFTRPEGPYVYPFFTRNGPAVRKQLAARSVYVPTLWPNVPEDPGASGFERDFAENLLPLPCDQRYGGDEMNKLIEVLTHV